MSDPLNDPLDKPTLPDVPPAEDDAGMMLLGGFGGLAEVNLDFVLGGTPTALPPMVQQEIPLAPAAGSAPTPGLTPFAASALNVTGVSPAKLSGHPAANPAKPANQPERRPTKMAFDGLAIYDDGTMGPGDSGGDSEGEPDAVTEAASGAPSGDPPSADKQPNPPADDPSDAPRKRWRMPWMK